MRWKPGSKDNIGITNGEYNGKYYLEGPRTQIIGFQGPNTMLLMVFGP